MPCNTKILRMGKPSSKETNKQLKRHQGDDNRCIGSRGWTGFGDVFGGDGGDGNEVDTGRSDMKRLNLAVANPFQALVQKYENLSFLGFG